MKSCYLIKYISIICLLLANIHSFNNNSVSSNCNSPLMDSISKKIDYCIKNENYGELIKQMYKKANILFEQGDFTDALNVLDEGIELYEKNKSSYSIAHFYYMDLLNLKSMIFSYLALYDKALENILIMKKQNVNKDLLYEVKFYNGTGGIYAMKGDIIQADKHYKKAYELAKNIDDKDIRYEQIFFICNNHCGVFINNKQFDSANIYAMEAYKIAILMNDDKKKCAALKYFGTINRFLKKPELAINFYNDSYNLAIKNDMYFIIPFVKGNMAGCYLDLNQMNPALEAALEAVFVAKKYNMSRLEVGALEVLSDVYMAMGDFKQSLLTLLEANKLNDSLLSKENEEKFTEQQHKFEILQMDSDKKISEQNAEINRNRETIWILSVFLCFIVLVILTYFFYTIYNKNLIAEKTICCLEEENKKINDTIEEQNKKISIGNILLLKTSERVPAILSKFRALKSNVKMNNTSFELIKELEELVIHLISDDEISESSHYLHQISDEFYYRLQNKYTDLTINEMKLCALIRLGLSTKELIKVTGKSRNAINCIKFRIRKKMGLDTDVDMIGIFSKYIKN